MKLTQEDQETLANCGYAPEDLPQIEEAMEKAKYEYKGKRISRKRALELLGREDHLTGIARSAFHYTAARKTADGAMVLIDASAIFE